LASTVATPIVGFSLPLPGRALIGASGFRDCLRDCGFDFLALADDTKEWCECLKEKGYR
jgi:hypothetical protein